MPRMFQMETTIRQKFYAVQDEINKKGGSTDRALHRAGEAIRGLAIQFAPEDTGALKASITVTSAYGNDYMSRFLAAARLRPEEKYFAAQKPKQHGVAYIYPLMRYALFQEVGTIYNAAHPYMIPATRIASKVLPQEFRAIVNWGGWRGKPYHTEKF